MYMFSPPPDAQQSSRPSPAKSRRTKSVVWIESIFFAALCAVVSVGLVYGPSTAEADFVVTGLKTEWITSLSQYPIPGSVYESTGGTSFCCPGGGDEPISLFSLSATSVGPGVPLPGPDEVVHGEGLLSLNSIIVLDDDSVEIYSFRISGGPPVSEDLGFGDLSFGDTLPSGTWQTELLSLELMGQLTGLSGPTPVILRESPTLPSLGQHILTPLPDGSLHIDSFFDVFFELSLDGGPFVPADSPMRLDITAVVPEASQLLALGMLAMVPILAAWWRRHRKAAA